MGGWTKVEVAGAGKPVDVGRAAGPSSAAALHAALGSIPHRLRHCAVLHAAGQVDGELRRAEAVHEARPVGQQLAGGGLQGWGEVGWGEAGMSDWGEGPRASGTG